jgi:arsenite methyltransferase
MSSATLTAAAAPRGPVITSTHDSAELAATYEKVSDGQFEHGKQLIAALNISRGERVLDIGAGTGRLAAYVSELVGPSGHVVGIDPLALRIEIAQSKKIRNFQACVGRAEDLSEFSDASFDVVYLNSVFHWVEDKPHALSEIFRVLKANGRLGLNCQVPDRPHEARLLIRSAVVAARIDLDPYVAYPSLGISEDDLEKYLMAAGFVDYEGALRTLVDVFADVDALFAWSRSSTFGNFLADLSPADHARVRDALGGLLEPKYLSPEGICLKRHLTFATVRKPSEHRHPKGRPRRQKQHM